MGMGFVSVPYVSVWFVYPDKATQSIFCNKPKNKSHTRSVAYTHLHPSISMFPVCFLGGSITSTNSSSSLQAERKVTLVYFLGGVTYAEIAALRFLQQEDHPTDYIIATTHIINGDSFIDSIDTLP